MKLSVLISVLAPLVACDVSHLGYQYNVPATSYDVPFGSIGNLHHDRQYYHVNKLGTTPASILQTPIHEFTPFTGGETYHSFINQRGPVLDSFNNVVPTVSSTPGPVLDSFNNVVPTPGPVLDSFNNVVPTVSSTPGPVLDSRGQTSDVEVQKHLYFFSAPEEPEEVKPRIIVPPAPAKKNVKVLFIKAPTFRTSPVEIPVLPQNEDKTLVYVLVKKPEEGTIILPTQPPTKPTKPEVYFIKYKTQKEAEEAISHVQSGGGGDVSLSANSVDDHNFLSGIQESDLSQKLGPDVGFNQQQGFGGFVGPKIDSFSTTLSPLGVVSTTPSTIGVHQGFGGFGSFAGPKIDSFSTTLSPLGVVSTTPSTIGVHQGFGSFAGPKIDSFSTTLSPLGVVSTTPATILQGGGIHQVYGPPQKRSYH
ncbi:uncharacterized protein LOC123004465 [Tribolium madens]|uniref:uncharacterized protein LOC123004465 n=1 Tax=Tribolium madens TaxID=41895 RepID=UPI001CF737A8|nr:uncharacterized protein LOC123004465 [Tribolium madens]